MARIYVGTCSWADHKPFYPEGLPANEQITYYAQHFPIVELDSTFYRMMPVRNFRLWAERTPEGFLFDVKPFRQITWHDRDNPPNEANTLLFSETLQPLREADKLGAIHAQFPPWYKFSPQNLEYLWTMKERFPDDRVSVEFRNRTWLEGDHAPQLIETLRAHDLALTVVDEPQLGTGSVPTVLEVTNPDLVIVRFHGRNYKKWYAKVESTAERFDYLYSEQELAEWVPKVHLLAENAQEVHVLFNNNMANYAIQNAGQLRLMLQDSEEAGEVIEMGRQP